MKWFRHRQLKLVAELPSELGLCENRLELISRFPRRSYDGGDFCFEGAFRVEQGMTDHLMSNDPAWKSIPLCCRYRVVRFETLSVQTLEGVGERSRTVRWALGVLSGDQFDVLGAWPVPEPNATGWAEVFDDLKVRGVNGIGSVVSSDHVAVDLALQGAYPGAACLIGVQSAGPVRLTNYSPSRRSGASSYQQPPTVKVPSSQHIFLSGEGAAQYLQSRVKLAIARHGCFVGLEAACRFIDERLTRANLKLGPSHVAVGQPRRLSVSASACGSTGVSRRTKTL